MAKAYWVATYFGISDPNKMAEYGKLAAPALQQFGAKFLARGTAAMAYEKGIKDRVVLIEFESTVLEGRGRTSLRAHVLPSAARAHMLLAPRRACALGAWAEPHRGPECAGARRRARSGPSDRPHSQR